MTERQCIDCREFLTDYPCCQNSNHSDNHSIIILIILVTQK